MVENHFFTFEKSFLRSYLLDKRAAKFTRCTNNGSLAYHVITFWLYCHVVNRLDSWLVYRRNQIGNLTIMPVLMYRLKSAGHVKFLK